MKSIAVINVGGNTTSGPCRGRIFQDGSFKFIPIPEGDKLISKKMITYEKLGLGNYVPKKYVKSPAHFDPHFPSKTYGHAERGFGYEKILGLLEEGDILCFMATLDYRDEGEPTRQWIHPRWGTYIIGAYIIRAVYLHEEFLNLLPSKKKQFENNPHYIRKRQHAYYWIAGKKNSPGLFDIAFPLHDPNDRFYGNKFLRENFTTSTGKEAGNYGFYRHAMICKKRTQQVWERILEHSLKS